MKTANEKLVKKQQRNKLLLLPLLIIPSLALLFKVMGGGEGGSATSGYSSSLTASLTSGIPQSEANDLQKSKAENYAVQDFQPAEKDDPFFNNDFREGSLQKLLTATDSAKNGTIPMSALQKMDQQYFEFYKDSLKNAMNLMATQKSITNNNTGNKRKEPVVRTREQFDEDNKKNSQSGEPEASEKLLKAMIHGNQVIKSGTRVTIRLLESFESGDIVLEKNDIIFGMGSAGMSGRLMIKISSVPMGERVVPVNWTVYDLDGIEGIHVPFQLVDKNTLANQNINQGMSDAQAIADQSLLQSVTAVDPVVSTGVMAGTRLLGNAARNKGNSKRANFTVKLDSGNIIYISTKSGDSSNF
jgi:Conjugative transposon, TraM